MTNFTTKTFTQTPKCHTGNTRIYTEPNGGTLYIGGWSNGAWFDDNTHVIDLTGTEHKYWDVALPFDEVSKQFMPFLNKGYAGWLSLPFPDMKIPTSLKTYQQWHGIAMTIQNILKNGTDVLVACHGGHGRSGLFVAIVGYILNIKNDRSWSSPVEKVRMIHCNDAVETRAQEQFVYDILGLDIKITAVYNTDLQVSSWRYEKCPICGTQSTFIQDYGMCLGCEKKYRVEAPKKEFFTAGDLKTKGEVDHACDRPNCIGIWHASKCGHVVHDMIIIDGNCMNCHERMEEEAAIVARVESSDEKAPCALCQKETWYGKKWGVCYECSKIAETGTVDFVHNTITDPYRAVPHHCEDDGCVGIVVGDVCGHVVHNQEIIDGRCSVCREVDRDMGG